MKEAFTQSPIEQTLHLSNLRIACPPWSTAPKDEQKTRIPDSDIETERDNAAYRPFPKAT